MFTKKIVASLCDAVPRTSGFFYLTLFSFQGTLSITASTVTEPHLNTRFYRLSSLFSSPRFSDFHIIPRASPACQPLFFFYFFAASLPGFYNTIFLLKRQQIFAQFQIFVEYFCIRELLFLPSFTLAGIASVRLHKNYCPHCQ